MTLFQLVLARIQTHRHRLDPVMWLWLGHAYKNYGLYHSYPDSFTYGLLDEVFPDPAKQAEELDTIYVDRAVPFVKKALFAYQHAIKLKPDYAEAWEHLGEAYAYIHRRTRWIGFEYPMDRLSDKREGLELAVQAFQQAIKFDPKNAHVNALRWNKIAGVYFELEQIDDQAMAYREAIRNKPDDRETWHNLTTVYWNKREFDKVAQVCQEAVKHISCDVNSWYDLGYAYQELGRLREAVEAYEGAVRLKADVPGPWVHLGAIYANQGQIEEAVRLYRDAFKLKVLKKKNFYLARSVLEQSEQGKIVLHHLEGYRLI
jgi:tetratricopeptide (TPR) repeat protein